MKLANISRWADRSILYDAYSPAKPVMKAQISSFIDSQSDGSISKRRVVSFAPTETVPARRAITYSGETWLIGDVIADHWNNEVVRCSAASKKATGLYKLLTPAQAALGQTGVDAYGQVVYLKDTVNSTTESAYSPQHELHLAPGEPANKGYFVKSGTRYFRVRSRYDILDGFIVATCDELETPNRVACTLKIQGAYNKVTDSHTTSSVATYGILLDYYKLYGKDTAMDATMAPGDMTLVVAASVATPTVGSKVMFDPDTRLWRILGVYPELDGYRLHIRRE